jgi:drug/metabolite transporter (DMT)-like permease
MGRFLLDMPTSLIWLPASLGAGFFQAWRTAVQQRLRAELSLSGAGLVRYLYGAPLAIILAFAYLIAHDRTLPSLQPAFVLFSGAAGLAQIVGTLLLIAAFGYRNFVVGTAFSKTEAVQAAVFARVALDERLQPIVWLGIGFGVAGVLVLSLGGRKLSAREIGSALVQPAALCGLGAGACFALTSVLVKRATIELAHPDKVFAALVTLAVVMVSQTLMHGGFVLAREPQTLRRVLATWRMSSVVGILSACGSACWFIGFANAPVALVRIVGQVEVIFTLLFGHMYLKERTKAHETLGLLLVGTGVLLALLGG